MKIYLVVDEHGDYSDYMKTNIAAYSTREDAEAEVERLQVFVEARQYYNEVLGEFTKTSDGLFARREPPPKYDPNGGASGAWQQWSVRREAAAAVYIRERFPELAATQTDPAEFFSTDHEYTVEELELR